MMASAGRVPHVTAYHTKAASCLLIARSPGRGPLIPHHVNDLEHMRMA